MSLIDKVKSLFSGGSSADAHDHTGHDHSGHDHSHDAAATLPADPAGMPMSEPDADEDRPA
jgi:hypothetical protein